MDGQIRIEQVRQPDAQCLGGEAEEFTVGVETPCATGLLDPKPRLVCAVQQLVVDLPLDRPRLGGHVLIRRLSLPLYSSSRTRSATGSRASSAA